MYSSYEPSFISAGDVSATHVTIATPRQTTHKPSQNVLPGRNIADFFVRAEVTRLLALYAEARHLMYSIVKSFMERPASLRLTHNEVLMFVSLMDCLRCLLAARKGKVTTELSKLATPRFFRHGKPLSLARDNARIFSDRLLWRHSSADRNFETAKSSVSVENVIDLCHLTTPLFE